VGEAGKKKFTEQEEETDGHAGWKNVIYLLLKTHSLAWFFFDELS
jgi:hypothetical protein